MGRAAPRVLGLKVPVAPQVSKRKIHKFGSVAGRVVPLETEKGNMEEITYWLHGRYLPKLAWSEL